MYTIYEIKGVKIGVTTNFTIRQKQQKDLGEMIVLEDHTDIYKVSERERELQAEKGYRVDKNPYWYVRQVQSERAKTPEARKKALASIKQRAIIAISPDGTETVYSGMNEASRQLTKKTGDKFHQAGISMICSPKRKYKAHNGYTFKYA